MIDLLKTEAPFWKRVHTDSGSHWVDAADTDRRAADFWLDQMASEDA
jgi:molybdopterin synthase catalytic subunit